MPEILLSFRVAAIGPSDIEGDVQAIKTGVAELSEEFKDRQVSLTFHHWKELPPGLSTPQSYIDQQMDWQTMDFIVGLMATKVGAAADDGTSGTEHECNKIIDLYKRYGQPDLLFYFRKVTKRDVEDPGENARVEEFKKRLQAQGLAGKYNKRQDLYDKVKPALRAKIEMKLKLQQTTTRRIGEFPPNRTLSVEMIILSEHDENHIGPVIVVLKNARGELHLLDSRYDPGLLPFMDWVAMSMGVTKTIGKPLGKLLAETNERNFRKNTGIVQYWLGNILVMDCPNVSMNNVKLLLGEVKTKDGKLGFDFKDGTNVITRPAPSITKNKNGEWQIVL